MQKALVPSKFILGIAWLFRASRKSATVKSGIGFYGYDIKRYEINKNIELMAVALQIEDKGMMIPVPGYFRIDILRVSIRCLPEVIRIT